VFGRTKTCFNAVLAAEFGFCRCLLDARDYIYQRDFSGYAEDASAFQGRHNEKNKAGGDD
jgi:hypothetical protein